MKKLVTTYTFTAASKTVQAAEFVSLENVLIITNVTDNVIIYNFADPSKGATHSGTTLTLSYDTTSMSNGDKLQIYVDDGAAQPVSGEYNATAPTLTDGTKGGLQLEQRGGLKVALFTGATAIAAAVDNADGVAGGGTANNYRVIARNTVWNGSTWDRQRGDTTGSYVVDKTSTSSASTTSVANATSSTQLLASTASRKSASIYNDDASASLYVKFGTAASSSSFKVKIAPGEYYEFPMPIYTGVVHGIATAATGSARVSEES